MKTRIFVSSTYFDLSQVRENLRDSLLQIGHEPILSEFPSFPIFPELNTIDNCKKAVRENTDIFILVVGSRRGSLDTSTQKAITNIEYETAIEARLDVMVFVHEKVMTLLPVWEKNPDTDFSPHVDSPEVFRFVKRIRDEQRWVFQFRSSTDIVEVLRIQLSSFLRGLIHRKHSSRLSIPEGFENESKKAQEIARERSKFWEYKLTAELLKSKILPILARSEAVVKSRFFAPSIPLSGHDFFHRHLPARMADVVRIAENFKLLLPELEEAWGPPGTPGDALKILAAVNAFKEACIAMHDWEIAIATASPPEGLHDLRNSLRGIGHSLLKGVGDFVNDFSARLEAAKDGDAIKFVITFPSPDLAPFYKAIETLRQDPSVVQE
jgi:hypothetical protein